MPRPTLLLTGAAGFVGTAVLAEVARAEPTFRRVLLVRSASSAERLRSRLALYLGEAEAARVLAESALVLADLRSLDAGAPVPWAEITHVIHAAANTSFLSREDVFRTNVGGTLALVDRLRSAPRLARFLHVSTAYQCGAGTAALVPEDDAPGTGADHLVAYTRSKAEAEAALAERARDLPVIIARPSVIVGHTALGCRPSASLYWYYRALAVSNFTPFPPARRRDVVPVDYVAGALVRLLTAPALAHRVYHVSAGPGAAATWREIADELCRLHGVSHASPPVLADRALLGARKAEVLRACHAPDDGVLLSAMAAAFEFARYGAEVFDNARLLGEGLAPPPSFVRYAHRCAAEPPGRTVHDDLRDELD